MIELVLTINDRDGKYAEHAGVVLASIFSKTQQTINVHIVHDETLSEENKLKLTQLTETFHHNIYFYHVTIPDDMREASAGVRKIDHWTMASMYRLLLPYIIPVDRIIYLDCDIWVNMDINELWSIDLGGYYLGAVLDQGQNLDEYFTSLGLNGAVYFNSGVILFHLDNIRNKPTWYGEMLNFLRSHPTMTMPDQDILNSLYSSNYLQLDLRFNTFANAELLDANNKIVHFAGDNKWWDTDSPAASLYNSYLAMTPWSGEFTPEAVSEPHPMQQEEPVELPAVAVEESSLVQSEPPAPEIQHVEIQPEEIQPAEIQPVEIQLPENHVPEIPVPEVAAPILLNVPVPPLKRKRSRTLRLRRGSSLRKKRISRGKYRSAKKIKRIKHRLLLKKKALQSSAKKPAILKRKSIHVLKKAPQKKNNHRMKRTS